MRLWRMDQLWAVCNRLGGELMCSKKGFRRRKRKRQFLKKKRRTREDIMDGSQVVRAVKGP